MRDLQDYLRAYWAYISTGLGWIKAVTVVVVWFAGMFAPLGVRTFLEFPNWIGTTWMIGWSFLSLVFAPYGLWKHSNAQISRSDQPNAKGRG